MLYVVFLVINVVVLLMFEFVMGVEMMFELMVVVLFVVASFVVASFEKLIDEDLKFFVLFLKNCGMLLSVLLFMLCVFDIFFDCLDLFVVFYVLFFNSGFDVSSFVSVSSRFVSFNCVIVFFVWYCCVRLL